VAALQLSLVPLIRLHTFPTQRRILSRVQSYEEQSRGRPASLSKLRAGCRHRHLHLSLGPLNSPHTFPTQRRTLSLVQSYEKYSRGGSCSFSKLRAGCQHLHLHLYLSLGPLIRLHTFPTQRRTLSLVLSHEKYSRWGPSPALKLRVVYLRPHLHLLLRSGHLGRLQTHLPNRRGFLLAQYQCEHHV
jgi:hypothetical protein